MADATVSRLGQSNLAGDVEALFLEVWSGEVLEAFNKRQTTASRHLVRTIQNGKSAQFPILGTIGSAFHTAGAEITHQQVQHAAKTIVIDGLLLSAVFIDVLDDAKNHYDVRQPYTTQQGEALANEADQRVLRSFLTAAHTAVHINTALPGGDGTVDANVTSSSAALKSAVFTAAQSLDENNVPSSDRYLWVKPAEYYLLLADGEFIDRDFAGEGSKARATLPWASDLEVVKTNNMPQADDSALTTLPTALQNNYTTQVAVAGHRSAAGTVKLINMVTEGEYEIQRQGWTMVAKYAMGHDFLRPDAAYYIATDATF